MLLRGFVSLVCNLCRAGGVCQVIFEGVRLSLTRLALLSLRAVTASSKRKRKSLWWNDSSDGNVRA